ncbi:hypothetical protein BDF19DRAFT_454723 [Syncephalis fuscata]|nr:hypothetical protein BDF19DRAFT_454723 [Syncephalis fuscata]
MATATMNSSAAGSVTVDYKKLRYQWVNVIFFIVTTAMTIYAFFMVPMQWKTMVFAVSFYTFGGISITAGYHRHWSHRAYEATWPLRLLLALGGASAFQGSAMWWCRHHRAHHRWTDSEHDPYGAQKGLFWSHIGWLLYEDDPALAKTEKKTRRRVYDDDLAQDPILTWQYRNFLWIAPFMAFIFPTIVAGLCWGDWVGGYFYAGIIRVVATQHATFCVNSLAHYLGEISYEDEQTPRDHYITSIITFGEGYHNFHHTFPRDYRNAVRWWQYDPTKWFIWSCSKVGLAYGLRRFPENEVQKARVIISAKRLEDEKRKVDWGLHGDALPKYTMEEFSRACKEDKRWWTIVDGDIYDLAPFANEHPGGMTFMRTAQGRDVSNAFNGDVHRHRDVARRMLDSLRVATIVKSNS